MNTFDGYQQLSDGFEYNPDDPRTYSDQWEEWRLCRDTRDCDITTYPGHGDEQRSRPQPPKVVTKRSVNQIHRDMRNRR